MLPNAGRVLVMDSTILLHIKIVEGDTRENSYQEPLRPGYALTRDGEGASSGRVHGSPAADSNGRPRTD